ncbi:hypothetical protein KMW28_26215 [Flammeovirga yaeyamensis]|uniref:Outer membrane protein beta-barrel domain-containing protein n=1 Tax=Flammeovirga yaeyamensis TaxID=367791 RepID=A0AAX1NA03_9BACT|nr:hypothetical protein [Flammeovirga yaeyamensis]MBB3699202.1 hypothetical protein [Flammeovirga yaeyamensis]NMF35534.1 hypothetical protein [Flammeovirga yaeyamensis]QWG04393.1 hypothetical protein KMW28_26215 [Flammeovirga yaeyamensis]
MKTSILLSIITLLFISHHNYAQDIIVLKDGRKLKGKSSINSDSTYSITVDKSGKSITFNYKEKDLYYLKQKGQKPQLFDVENQKVKSKPLLTTGIGFSFNNINIDNKISDSGDFYLTFHTYYHFSPHFQLGFELNSEFFRSTLVRGRYFFGKDRRLQLFTSLGIGFYSYNKNTEKFLDIFYHLNEISNNFGISPEIGVDIKNWFQISIAYDYVNIKNSNLYHRDLKVAGRELYYSTNNLYVDESGNKDNKLQKMTNLKLKFLFNIDYGRKWYKKKQ